MISYDELKQKYLEKYSTLPLPFHAEDHKQDLIKHIRVVYDYLGDREDRMAEKCDFCGDKYRRGSYDTTITDIKGYGEEKDTTYYFCSYDCREHFEDGYSYCECGRWIDRSDIWADDYTVQCIVCKSQNVFDNGMIYEDLDNTWFINNWILPTSREAHVKQSIKKIWRLHGLCGDVEFIYTALKECKIGNGKFLVVPYKERYCVYLENEEVELEEQLMRIKLKSLLRI